MAKIGYTVGTSDGLGSDLGDLLVQRDIFSEGNLFAWGYNGLGNLGDSTTTNRSSPVQTIAGGSNWKQVACGASHASAIKTDGTLWGWGYNGSGQLGDSTTTNKSSPVQTIAGGSNWKQVSGGGNHTTAIKTDGTLWTWGYNAYGQLGDSTLVSRSSPVQTIAGGTNWKQVSCGYHSISAIKTDGTLWGWGLNSSGQLGDSTTITIRSSPVQTIAGGTNWEQVACGDLHVFAIKTDGTLWGWGQNSFGQLGDSTLTNRSSPVQTIAGGSNWKQVACGASHASAIKTDGTLWGWGWNSQCQLGDSTSITSRSSPVQTIAGGTNWKQVAGGAFNTTAIKTDGTLWTWGQGSNGSLGDSTTTTKSSPVQTIAGGTNWKQVSAGVYYTAAITYEDL